MVCRVKERLRELLLDLIKKERDGEKIDRDLVRSVTQMLLDMGKTVFTEGVCLCLSFCPLCLAVRLSACLRWYNRSVSRSVYLSLCVCVLPACVAVGVSMSFSAREFVPAPMLLPVSASMPVSYTDS